MSQPVVTYLVETCSVKLVEGEDGFVMDLVTSDNASLRIRFPAWVVYQLMRALPHVDAAIQQRGTGSTASLIAYPVVQWSIEQLVSEQGIALWVRDDRDVDSACCFTLAAATTLYRELHAAITHLQSSAGAHPTNSG